MENEVKYKIWCSEDSSEDYMYDEIEDEIYVEKCDLNGLEEGEECEQMCYNGLHCSECMCRYVGKIYVNSRTIENVLRSGCRRGILD